MVKENIMSANDMRKLIDLVESVITEELADDQVAQLMERETDWLSANVEGYTKKGNVHFKMGWPSVDGDFHGNRATMDYRTDHGNRIGFVFPIHDEYTFDGNNYDDYGEHDMEAEYFKKQRQMEKLQRETFGQLGYDVSQIGINEVHYTDNTVQEFQQMVASRH